MAYDFNNPGGASPADTWFSTASVPITAAPFSMACWFITNQSLDRVLMSLGNSADDSHHEIFANQGGPNLIACNSKVAGSAAISTSGTYSDGVWTHAGGVWASTTSRTAYFNGVAGTTNTTSKSPTIDRFRIGARASSTDGNTGCQAGVAECAIWNVALTTAEMEALAEGYSPLFIRPESLINYWPLVRDLTDSVGGLTLSQTGTNVDVYPHTRVMYPSRKFVSAFTPAAGGGGSVGRGLTQSLKLQRLALVG